MARLPKVGIRPTIDGRQLGVRESLEDQTMQMAENVAKLISSTLKYPNGEPVECVIADSKLARVKETEDFKEKFEKENVGLTITVRHYRGNDLETMELDNRITHAVCGFKGIKRPGAVYLAEVLAAFVQKGIPAFGIYGEHVQEVDEEEIDEEVVNKLLKITKSGLSVALMKDKSFLS